MCVLFRPVPAPQLYSSVRRSPSSTGLCAKQVILWVEVMSGSQANLSWDQSVHVPVHCHTMDVPSCLNVTKHLEGQESSVSSQKRTLESFKYFLLPQITPVKNLTVLIYIYFVCPCTHHSGPVWQQQAAVIQYEDVCMCVWRRVQGGAKVQRHPVSLLLRGETQSLETAVRQTHYSICCEF